MDVHNEFIAQEKTLVFYAGKPVINKRHAFFDIDGNPWPFTDATGFTWNIWEERDGGIKLIAWTSPDNLSSADNEIILNASAESTNIGIGRYYYEIEYLISGGYPILIAYGQARFI